MCVCVCVCVRMYVCVCFRCKVQPHINYCGVVWQVFKDKGGDRKQKTDQMRMDKLSPSEKVRAKRNEEEEVEEEGKEEEEE